MINQHSQAPGSDLNNTSQPLRLGIFDKYNLAGFSGIPKKLVSSLADLPDLKVDIYNYERHYHPAVLKRVQKKLARLITGKSYVWEKEPSNCQHVSRELDRFISLAKPDAVLMFGSEGCAYSTSMVPIYCYADSIFGSRAEFYSDQINMSAISVKHGRMVQQLALDRVSNMFISSQWAVDEAVRRYQYQFDDAKFRVVGIGANLPSLADADPPIEVPFAEHQMSFIWIGVDWERKQGKFAVEVVRALREKGLGATLHVIGPVDYIADEEWVRVHGRLDYSVPEDFQKFCRLCNESCGLILPSTADLTPCVIAEAFAFGRPVFASNVGGIPEMLTDASCGFTMTGGIPSEWAGSIVRFYDKYKASRAPITTACRDAFLTRYNWSTIARKIANTINANSV